MDIKILVATHKKYVFPKNELYEAIHVGKEGASELGYPGDDVGINISEKNNNFCELTALYWAWKNNYFEEYKVCGLMHYRRYLKGKSCFLNKKILSENDIHKVLNSFDIIVPKSRNYYIETVETHYQNAHKKEDLDKLKEIIKIDWPDYVESLKSVLNRRYLFRFNMFIMKTELFYSYAEWLFDILFKLEKQIDITDYDKYQQRVFGFLSERLFNIWILKNNYSIKEVSTVNIEREPILIKGFNMIKRKLKI